MVWILIIAQEIPQIPTAERYTLVGLLVFALCWIAGLLVYFIKNWVPKSQYDDVFKVLQEQGKSHQASVVDMERRCKACMMVNGTVLKEINGLVSELETVQNMNTQTLQGINHLLELILYGGQHGGHE